MKVIVEKSKVDFDKVKKGCLVLFENSAWTILFNQESDKFNVASLKSDEVLREFENIIEVRNYLMGFSDIEEILLDTEFSIKVVKNK